MKRLLQNKKILIIVIIVLLLSVIGFSYAFYIFTIGQKTSNLVTSDCFKLTYKDKNDIAMEYAYPLSEEEGNSLTPYEFTVKNVCKYAAEYDINLEKINGSTMSDQFIRAKLDNEASFLLSSKEIRDTYVNKNVSSSRNIGEGLLLANEEKTYNLRMWIDEDSTIEAAEKTYTSKVVIVAKLNKNPYQNITLNLNGGTIDGDTTLQGVVKQTLGDKLKNPTKEGYNFIGWYSTSTFDNGTGVSSDTMITNEISNLYANYSKGTYELTIDEDNGNISTHQVEYQSTYNLNEPTKVGYTFDGWEVVSGNSTINNNVVTMGSEAARVKAKWIINSYTLTISNSNTCDGDHTLEYNSTYELCTPSKTGYTFSGWNYESGSLSGNTFTIGASNVEVSATWTINTYKWLVNHKKQNLDGLTYTLEETTTGQGEYNTTYPTSDIRKNYSGFTSPNPYPTGTITIDKTPVDEGYATNNILDYNYTRNKYDLIINPNGGSYNNQTSNTIINEYYEKEFEVINPTRDGYTFSGWSNETNFTNTTYKMPVDGETINATWTPNEYTITFNVNGGDTLSNNTKNVTYDSTYGSLPTPSRSGYVFAGWYLNEEKIESETIVKITQNETLVASYQKIVTDLPYSGSVQEFIANVPGIYKLEVWGAQGGTNENDTSGLGSSIGGYGGYSVGNINLQKDDSIYAVVGEMGHSWSQNVGGAGGYNGGGTGGDGYYPQFHAGGGGGGATHLATNLVSDGKLSNYLGNLFDVIMIAGGGGGAAHHGIAGGGGGITGGPAYGIISSSELEIKVLGGGQTTGSGYAFGAGQPGKTKTASADGGAEGTGGAGAGLYGGFASQATGNYTDCAGAGGSGYIGNSNLTNKQMYCYNCSESSDLNTYTVSTYGTTTHESERDTTNCPNGYSNDPIAKCAKAGHGYARITLISVN